MKTLDEIIVITLNFLSELRKLENKYNLELDCHGDFVSYLVDKNTKKIVCILRDNCEPDFEM